MRARFKRWGWVLLLIPVLLAGGFIYWAQTPLAPMPEALAALQADGQVQVESGRWTVFRPVSVTPSTGLIFYPGGRVDYRAYAPPLHEIASQGYLVVLAPMPLSLAVFAPNKADEIIPAFPEIKFWAIGGHSLGGAMAASYAYNHPGRVQGLALWASYPAENNDLSAQDLAVVSIYGTLDGLATTGKIDASRPLLPATAQFVPIEGGNHAQFGWYGEQPGDNPATISRDDQQARAIAVTLAFLEQISKEK